MLILILISAVGFLGILLLTLYHRLKQDSDGFFTQNRQLTKPDFVAESDFRFYLFGDLYYPIAIWNHLILILLFWHTQQWILIIFNIALSLPSLISGWYFHTRKGKFKLPYILFCLELIIYNGLSTIIIGWETGFHYHVLVSTLFPLVCTSLSRFEKIILTSVSIATYVFLSAIHSFHLDFLDFLTEFHIIFDEIDADTTRLFFITNALHCLIAMVQILTQYIKIVSLTESRSKELQDQILQQEREVRQSLEEELIDAQRMQTSLLPEHTPEIGGIQVSALSIPALEVGGDFYEYLEGQEDLKIAVADVSGKGLKAAMNAVMASGILNLSNTYQKEVSRILFDMNVALCNSMEQDMNVTMTLAQFSRESKQMTLVNAGQHAYPLLVRKREVQQLQAKGLALGMMPSITYKPLAIDLQSEDIVLFMTDGITEPRNSQGVMYESSGRFHKLISSLQEDMTAEEIAKHIVEDVTDYMVDNKERDDDITLVVVKVV